MHKIALPGSSSDYKGNIGELWNPFCFEEYTVFIRLRSGPRVLRTSVYVPFFFSTCCCGPMNCPSFWAWILASSFLFSYRVAVMP